MKEIVLEVIRFPLKIYLITWTYVLILKKRRVPDWLQKEFSDQFKNELPLGKPEKYRM